MKNFFFLIIIIVVVGGGWFFLRLQEEGKTILRFQIYQKYILNDFGVHFAYPKNYFLVEKQINTVSRRHFQVTLLEDTPENRLLVEGKLPGREGPPAITIDTFQNNLDRYTGEDWIRRTSFSNFKLGNGVLEETLLGGEEAFAYSWSGLYEGRSVVRADENNVYMFSVTYLAPSDQIVKNFNSILQTVEF